jgi:hypothetical protein
MLPPSSGSKKKSGKKPELKKPAVNRADTLKMKPIFYSKKSAGFQRTARRCIPENMILHPKTLFGRFSYIKLSRTSEF